MKKEEKYELLWALYRHTHESVRAHLNGIYYTNKGDYSKADKWEQEAVEERGAARGIILLIDALYVGTDDPLGYADLRECANRLIAMAEEDAQAKTSHGLRHIERMAREMDIDDDD